MFKSTIACRVQGEPVVRSFCMRACSFFDFSKRLLVYSLKRVRLPSCQVLIAERCTARSRELNGGVNSGLTALSRPRTARPPYVNSPAHLRRHLLSALAERRSGSRTRLRANRSNSGLLKRVEKPPCKVPVAERRTARLRELNGGVNSGVIALSRPRTARPPYIILEYVLKSLLKTFD